MKKKKGLVFVFILIVSTLYGAGSKEEVYPNKTIKVIVPWAPGGLAPVLAEVIKPLLAEELGVSVITENKPGGGTAVGTKELQLAPADGYTIGMQAATIFGITHTTKGDVDYRNFDLIASVTEDYYAITVNANSPWKTLAELLTYIKANPGKVRAGHSGIGTAWHVAAIVFNQDMGVEMLPVPFTGGGPAVTALLGDHLEVTTVPFGDMTAVLPTGQVRVLAVGAPERDPFFPDIPTVKEAAGIASSFGSFRCFLAPKGVPPERLKVLEDALKRVTQNPVYVDFCKKNGINNSFVGRVEFQKKYAFYAEKMIGVLESASK
jgi:tripartite-type tricarboxylate transporter receptor subunit TctC